MARAQKVVDLGWPGWVRIVTSGALRAKNFSLRVVFKVVGDNFAAYQPTLQRIIEVDTGHQPKLSNAALFFETIGTATELCMPDERSLSFDQAMARYRNPKSSGSLGLVNLLAQLGEKRNAISQILPNDLPVLEQVATFVMKHPLLDFLGAGFVQKQVGASLSRVDELVDCKVFAVSTPEARECSRAIC